MNSVRVFAAALSTYLDPGIVEFRGSFANNAFDEFSDIDFEAGVSVPLDERFFISLEAVLTRRFGPALIRYDPDYRNTTRAQDVRFSFYGFPIFWRVDLIVRSDCDSGRKYPDPFPDWSAGTSALMNTIWALKHNRRGKADDANHYLTMACRKLGLTRVETSADVVLDVLGRRDDVDAVLLARTHETILYP